MIIDKKYAKRLIKQGKAAEVGLTTDQPPWAQHYQGTTYVIIDRYDLQRADHYEDNSRA